MSESSSNNTIPTNEEIISELTKDLESHCIKSEKQPTHANQAGDENLINPTEVIEPSDSLENNYEDAFDTEDCDKKNDKKSSSVDDYIDEEILKDLELTLTPDEKEERRAEAEELKKKGNEEFKHGNHMESLKLYTEGLKLCPLSFPNDRSMLYSNRAAAKAKLGNEESAIDDCTEAIKLNENYVRALLRRAQLYENTKKLDEALDDYKKVLELDPNCKEAIRGVATLPEQINIRNEEMKTEMLGKLKDLGNMFLKPFGLSTDNFQMTKDPNTGGYSVNFSNKGNNQ